MFSNIILTVCVHLYRAEPTNKREFCMQTFGTEFYRSDDICHLTTCKPMLRCMIRRILAPIVSFYTKSEIFSPRCIVYAF